MLQVVEIRRVSCAFRRRQRVLEGVYRVDEGEKRGRGSVLRIGPYIFRNAFIQQLANGRWQVMRRLGKPRYPIDVVKVPLETPLTQSFTAISKQLIDSDMPKELSAALKNQLRIHLKR